MKQSIDKEFMCLITKFVDMLLASAEVVVHMFLDYFFEREFARSDLYCILTFQERSWEEMILERPDSWFDKVPLANRLFRKKGILREVMRISPHNARGVYIFCLCLDCLLLFNAF